MKLVPYYKSWNEFGYTWEEIKLTGRWKIITGGPYNKEPRLYLEHNAPFLGRIIKIWTGEDEIELFSERKEYINEC